MPIGDQNKERIQHSFSGQHVGTVQPQLLVTGEFHGRTSSDARNNNKVSNRSGHTPGASAGATDGKIDLGKWVVPAELGISPYFSPVSFRNWHHWGYVQYRNSTLSTMEGDYKEFRRGLEILSTADFVPQKIKKRGHSNTGMCRNLLMRAMPLYPIPRLDL
ncbi:hypothetical protein BGX34_005021 [Mortierella sp. NVP85]|nr:hypothetical protein BGX34_005021 [Mortierella sp. NVP85]